MHTKQKDPSTDYKSWISSAGLNRTMGVYTSEGELLVTLKLVHYSIIDGVVKLQFLINGSVTGEMGMGEFSLTPEISIRVYSPIELHQLMGCGYSPKMVYRLPRSYIVKEHKPKPKPSFYDRARSHEFEGQVNV